MAERRQTIDYRGWNDLPKEDKSKIAENIIIANGFDIEFLNEIKPVQKEKEPIEGREQYIERVKSLMQNIEILKFNKNKQFNRSPIDLKRWNLNI